MAKIYDTSTVFVDTVTNIQSAFCQEHMLHILSGMCVNIIVQAINHFFLHQLIHIGLIEMTQPEVPNGR